MAFVDDIALADRLRLHNPEQFHTLVRMHLSFVLDLNTDEYESGIEKGKVRALKWSFVPFCKKSKCIPKEGIPLTQNGILQISQLISFLSLEQNIIQEGIFRRSGKMTRQQELKNLLNNGLPLNLDSGNFTAHDCASVLKNFLSELSESLLTDAHYPAYCQIAELCAGGKNSEGRLLRALQLLLLLLPAENRALLQDILQLLNLAASNEKSNKMSAENLATLFTPHLLCPRKLTPEALHINSQTMSGVIAFMIQNVCTLFNIPPKLAVDIRAYWAEKERRKLSPKKELNESVCDGTANTVFSFVDRERTAQAYVANPTETALAQLYAHIQSLPESSKKRKLVKQFNKENGQGTPVQKNHHRSRSLGDSIKKHILSKGLRRAKACIDEGQYTVTRSHSQEALNETMMTPRSRKPVVLLSGSNLCHLANVGAAQPLPPPPPPSQDSVSSSSGGNSSFRPADGLERSWCDSGDSLTSTFRSYLLSRSVLTASPVDLSFSSRTGDFDTSSSSGKVLSDSLMYCLNGNDPEGLSDLPSSSERPVHETSL